MKLYKKWNAILPSILLSAILFIGWDFIFTHYGIWGFNPLHLTGIYLWGLPIEEMMFFFTVPYASIFIYEVFKSMHKSFLSEEKANYLNVFVVISLFITGLYNYDKLYTSITFISAAIFILIAKYILKYKNFGLFYFSYAIILIPFLFTNGILTGSFIEQEVVWYNPLHNLNIRIYTIPIEDSVYGFFLILLSISLYERKLAKNSLQAA